MRVAGSLRLATSLLVAVSGAAIAQDSIPAGDWRTINRDAAATRFSPLDDINRAFSLDVSVTRAFHRMLLSSVRTA